MQFFKVFALQACVAIVAAAPQSGTLEERGSPSVYFCQQYQWQGICASKVVTPNKCQLIPTNLVGLISAVGPNKEAGFCKFYKTSDCSTLDALGYYYPGSDYYGTYWNDAITSFICDGVSAKY